MTGWLVFVIKQLRAFGDFETDLKRSDSGSIPDRKVCFLTFICSLNTFQSKNPTLSHSSLHFQPDEKRGKRIQKLQEETVKPRSKIQNVRGERMLRFSLVPQSTSNLVSEAGTKNWDQDTNEAPREKNSALYNKNPMRYLQKNKLLFLKKKIW